MQNVENIDVSPTFGNTVLAAVFFYLVFSTLENNLKNIFEKVYSFK